MGLRGSTSASHRTQTKNYDKTQEIIKEKIVFNLNFFYPVRAGVGAAAHAHTHTLALTQHRFLVGPIHLAFQTNNVMCSLRCIFVSHGAREREREFSTGCRGAVCTKQCVKCEWNPPATYYYYCCCCWNVIGEIVLSEFSFGCVRPRGYRASAHRIRNPKLIPTNMLRTGRSNGARNSLSHWAPDKVNGSISIWVKIGCHSGDECASNIRANNTQLIRNVDVEGWNVFIFLVSQPLQWMDSDWM